jgi:hypothetical protein
MVIGTTSRFCHPQHSMSNFRLKISIQPFFYDHQRQPYTVRTHTRYPYPYSKNAHYPLGVTRVVCPFPRFNPNHEIGHVTRQNSVKGVSIFSLVKPPCSAANHRGKQKNRFPPVSSSIKIPIDEQRSLRAAHFNSHSFFGADISSLSYRVRK